MKAIGVNLPFMTCLFGVNYDRNWIHAMTSLTIENARSQLKKIDNTNQVLPENSIQNKIDVDTLYVYSVSFDSVVSNEHREIAFSAQPNQDGLLIYVNKFSKQGWSYFDFFDNEEWVIEKLLETKESHSKCQSFPSALSKFPSLNCRKQEVLKLRLEKEKDFRILLLWYVGYSYTRDEIRRMFLKDSDLLPSSQFSITSSKVIEDRLLDENSLLLFMNIVFGIKEKELYHRKTIGKIIGNEKEKNFYDSDRSAHFKVLSLFTLLSNVKKIWHQLVINNAKFPSLSNNPVALEYDGFKDSRSIHTSENKRINDVILRFFYNNLIQSALINQPSLKPILLSENECLTTFDIQLAEFDIYIQKLFDLCMVRKPSYQDGNISTAVDEAFLDTRRYVDALLQKFDTEAKLTKDDLILTLVKCASINRAENDYDFILKIYANIENDIPDKIDLMKSVRDVNEIIDVLLKIFDIEKNEIPEDLIRCATIVNEMFSRFYNREATPEERNQFQTKIFTPAYVGASAALLLNGYIKSNRNKSRTKDINDFTIHIRGATNREVNVYNELSKIEKSYSHGKKSLSALLYCMPDDLYKFLTARYSIVVAGMGSHLLVKDAALDALKLKKRKIEIQKEIIEQFKDYSIEYSYDFVKYFKSHVIKFESLIKDPTCIINLWLSQ